MAEGHFTPTSRRCKKCEAAKPASEFYKQSNKIGLSSLCKPCYKDRVVKWKGDNKDRVSEINRRWREANRESEAARMRAFRRRQAIHGHESEEQAARRKSRARRAKQKLRKDPKYRAFDNVRRSILYALRGKQKSGRTFELLGYSLEDLCAHIEKQFLPKMSWDNYGEWHVDHIVPIAEHFRNGVTDPAIVNCLTNLRPIWAKDNMSKGDMLTHLL